MKPYNISSTLHKLLGLQAAFRSTIQPSFPLPFSYFRTLSSSPSANTDANRIITYWFQGQAEDLERKWFMGGSKVDLEIREQFGSLVEQARASQLHQWTEQPKGTLALLILLDQFSRNLYRGSPLSYSADSIARNITLEAIAKGFDRQVPHIQQPFFYLPLMHHESLVSQVASVSLYDSLVLRSPSASVEADFAHKSKHAAERHRDCILKFGRFPSRNEVLGRESTPEEIEHLKQNPGGF